MWTIGVIKVVILVKYIQPWYKVRNTNYYEFLRKFLNV
jgi:hypothetical protein